MPEPRRVAFMLELEWLYKRHTGIFAGTQKYALKQGWHSIIDEYAGHSLQNDVHYDGIIARATNHLTRWATKLGVPLVNVWFSSPATDLLPGVFSDFSTAGRMRAELLLARGFRKFATLTDRTNRGHDVEVKEFCNVVQKEGFKCSTARISLNRTGSHAHWRRVEKRIVNWMESWQLPIGVFVGSEDAGRMVVQLCNIRGWRVPEDVSIICGANEESLCVNPRPSISSLEMGHERIGYEAARMLDGLMNKNKSKRGKNKSPKSAANVEHIFLPPLGLVLRESTDFFAVEDKLVGQALEFIAINSHKPIGPDDVAKAVATQPRTLQRRFRKFLGRPIATEIRRVRIDRAKRELSQTDRSISAISANVGFGTTMRMYQVFVRELGVTPSEYRKQRQIENA